jgi:hypothetical protein
LNEESNEEYWIPERETKLSHLLRILDDDWGIFAKVLNRREIDEFLIEAMKANTRWKLFKL